jgi:hypothetical protein
MPMTGRHRLASIRTSTRQNRVSPKINLKDIHIASLGHPLQGLRSIFLPDTNHRHAMKSTDQGLPTTLRLSSLQDRLREMSTLEKAQLDEVWPMELHS